MKYHQDPNASAQWDSRGTGGGEWIWRSMLRLMVIAKHRERKW